MRKSSSLTATVQFCGAGGTSEAARQAGIHVEAAINHSPLAIATHAANHPDCLHVQQRMEECNPDALPDSDLLLSSPCCTNHAPAKGQKRYHQFDLFGEVIFDPLAEKSRNTMDDVVRFARAKSRAGKPYTFIVVENVVEVVKWRKYPAWLHAMTALGYQYRTLYWNTQFFGIPQSRDRVYMVFWLPEVPAPDLEYRPSAFCGNCEGWVQAVQGWKTSLPWGCYRHQYTYRCPQCAQEVVPPCSPVSSVLDVAHQGERLASRKKPLAPKTLNKLHQGITRLQGHPFLLGYYQRPLFRRLDEPVGTITTLDRWAYVQPAPCFDESTLRMLSPEEIKGCMGFPASYHLSGTAKQQIWLLGNAVCPPLMRTLLTRCLAVMKPSQSDQKENTLCSNK